ncbi:MAG: lysophospholipid acyltransferase family protein [Cyanobacteria bacterium J06598_3]
MSSSLAQPMANPLDPLELSRWMLFSMGVDIRVHHRERLPRSPFLMISNHRSFLDAPLLMAAAARPVHFACHHYMAQVPVMRNVVDALGCFPLDEPAQRGRTFFKQAAGFLRSQKSIGVFPEGTGPMVSLTPPTQMGDFHRGFAHLALRASRQSIQPDLQVVPAAIIALEEKQQDTVPFKLLGWFDPTEPLFQKPGLHPAVIYRRVAVVIGKPIAMADFRRQDYHGKGASQLVSDLSDTCHQSVLALLQTGCY